MKKRDGWLAAVLLAGMALWPGGAWAMHIMEGFLPLGWALFWFGAALPFLALGLRKVNRLVKENPEIKMLLGLSGAFAFVLSALKIPSVTGSSSHPTGTGLGAVLFGPLVSTVIAFVVLLFQALLLAHGGLSTLGANVFSMGVVGPWLAYGVFRLAVRAKLNIRAAVFLAAFVGDLATYLTTSFQLALAFPAAEGGFAASLLTFLGIFAVTQIPLAASEGLLSVLVFNFLKSHSREELKDLQVVPAEGWEGAS